MSYHILLGEPHLKPKCELTGGENILSRSQREEAFCTRVAVEVVEYQGGGKGV